MTTQYTNVPNTNAPKWDVPLDKGGATETGGAMTLEQLLALCVRLQPVEAARREDSDLCVTPLITRLIVDGELVDLTLKNGRWGAGYPRVSGEVQRAAGSTAGKTARKGRQRKSTQQVMQMQQRVVTGPEEASDFLPKVKGTADGYSEEEQLVRQIRHFVRQGLAFKIYSDCGLTRRVPQQRPALDPPAPGR